MPRRTASWTPSAADLALIAEVAAQAPRDPEIVARSRALLGVKPRETASTSPR